jgi:hypothetical protein
MSRAAGAWAGRHLARSGGPTARLALAQDGHGLVIDGDDTCPAALGRSFDAFTSDHGRRSSDGDLLAVEVNVLPPQVEQLAAACSGVGRDVKEGEQPVLLRGGQERPELVKAARLIERPGATLCVGRAHGKAARWSSPETR